MIFEDLGEEKWKLELYFDLESMILETVAESSWL